MKYEFSPIVTIVLNIIAGALVAKGVLDTNSRDTFIQLTDNVIAGLVTLGIGVFSISKMVDLHKHKISNMPSTQSTTTSIQPMGSATVPVSTAPVSQPATNVEVDQSGLPTSAEIVNENQPVVNNG